VAGRYDGVLLGGAAGRTQVGGLPDPYPEAQHRCLNALTDGVDHPGAVLVRDLRRTDGEAFPRPATRLPISRVDAGAVYPDPHFTRSGVGHRTFDQREDFRATGHGILDRTHPPTVSSAAVASTSPNEFGCHLKYSPASGDTSVRPSFHVGN
jgi:hypothetical protein